ncbi:MAG TPA: hypothetical protein VFS21_10840 [Roseiflexaceae bacterium]|nr:hypothetical protein [Roseiflexaceae bacterium]
MWERERCKTAEQEWDEHAEYAEWEELCATVGVALERWWEYAPSAQQVRSLAGEP